MGKYLRLVAAIALLLGASIGAAQADFVFSNVVIEGSLAEGASYTTGDEDIDFYFPEAVVGDPVDPVRFGNIIITYEAHGTGNSYVDEMILSILGTLSGSGTIHFSEVIEDMANPGVIATYDVTLDQYSQLPHVAYLDFDRPSDHIKVKKTAVLTAEETDAYDFASLSLIEQTLVPEPVTGLLAVIGLLALRRR